MTILDISSPVRLGFNITKAEPDASCPDVFALSAIVDGDTAYSVDGEGIRKVQIFIPEWLR